MVQASDALYMGTCHVFSVQVEIELISEQNTGLRPSLDIGPLLVCPRMMFSRPYQTGFLVIWNEWDADH
ncbi:hypothetical protein TNCV_3288221 [Trichonephila clavipes]|nr:hypothetical protein TNCV_3288221 [Trichonephila clavipes]